MSISGTSISSSDFLILTSTIGSLTLGFLTLNDGQHIFGFLVSTLTSGKDTSTLVDGKLTSTSGFLTVMSAI